MSRCEHGCDASRPVCACGHRWDYVTHYARGPVYTSDQVVAKYHALYGVPELPFAKVTQ